MQEPQPQLAELLRTCVHPPSLLLEIVRIEFLDVKDPESTSNDSLGDGATNLLEDTHRYAVKYILSDGEIMMQALLHRKISGLRDAADVIVGDLLDIRHFSVKKSPRLEGKGRVVYLAIEDCHFIQRFRSPGKIPSQGQEVATTKVSRKRKRTPSHSNAAVEGGADLHSEIIGSAKEIDRPPHAKRPSVYQVSEQTASRADESAVTTPVGMSKLQQPACATTDSATPRNRPLPATFQQGRKDDDEHGEKSYIKRDVDKRDSNKILKNTFGARQVIFDDDEDDFFEALPTNQNTIKQRRRALQKLDGNTSFSSQVSSLPEKPDQDENDLPTPTKPPKFPFTPLDKTPTPIIPDRAPPPPLHIPKKSVRDGTFALSQTPASYFPQQPPAAATNPHPPQRQVQTQPPPPPQPSTQPTLLPSPPFHTLSSLRNPPNSEGVPSKSYTLTTLAIISWTGTTTIHRPGSLFPPKRHLKIIDPTLATSRPPSRQVHGRLPAQETNTSNFRAQNSFQDAVTVAVYIDAANFKPAAGTVVLFRGLVMQRLVNGDIILNAYGRLKDQRFAESLDNKTEVDENANQELVEDNDAVSENAKINNHWFVTDHAKIRRLGHGSRLDYYLEWWAEKQRGQQSVQN